MSQSNNLRNELETLQKKKIDLDQMIKGNIGSSLAQALNSELKNINLRIDYLTNKERKENPALISKNKFIDIYDNNTDFLSKKNNYLKKDTNTDLNDIISFKSINKIDSDKKIEHRIIRKIDSDDIKSVSREIKLDNTNKKQKIINDINSEDIKNYKKKKQLNYKDNKNNLLEIYENFVKDGNKDSSKKKSSSSSSRKKSPIMNKDEDLLKSSLINCYEILKIIKSLDKSHLFDKNIVLIKNKTKKIAKNLDNIYKI